LKITKKLQKEISNDKKREVFAKSFAASLLSKNILKKKRVARKHISFL
jgi:hypothetical protein